MVSGTINDRPPQLCGGSRVRKKDDLKIIEAVVVGVYSRYVSLKTCETNVPFTIAVGDLPKAVLENRTRALAPASMFFASTFCRKVQNVFVGKCNYIL